MKKMILLITLFLSLPMLANASKVTKSDETTKEYVQVVDVGYPTDAIINVVLNNTMPEWQIADVQDEQTEINLTKQIEISADYCEPLIKAYDTGIGKTLLIENLKVQIKTINRKYNDLNQRYRILYFQVNGVLPSSTIRLCN